MRRRLLLLTIATGALLLAAPGRAQLWLTHGEAAEFGGEPAVRFQIYHQHGTVLAWCVGYLYFTPTQVAYEVLGPSGYRQDGFAAARETLQVQWRGLRAMKRSTGLFSPPMMGQSVEVKILNGRKYDFFVARNIGSDGSSEFDSVSLWPLQNSWEKFDEALERARTRWDPNRPPPPPPETALALADVLKLLEGGVTPARLETIVRERGVTFTLTDDAESKLRALGATDTLLLAIAKNRK